MIFDIKGSLEISLYLIWSEGSNKDLADMSRGFNHAICEIACVNSCIVISLRKYPAQDKPSQTQN